MARALFLSLWRAVPTISHTVRTSLLPPTLCFTGWLPLMDLVFYSTAHQTSVVMCTLSLYSYGLFSTSTIPVHQADASTNACTTPIERVRPSPFFHM